MDLHIDNNLNYTFVRGDKNKKFSQILELRDGVYGWTNDLDNCCGYFRGNMVTESLCGALNESIDGGWLIYIDSFNNEHQHVETYSQGT